VVSARLPYARNRAVVNSHDVVGRLLQRGLHAGG